LAGLRSVSGRARSLFRTSHLNGRTRQAATLASGEEDGTLYLAMAYVEGSDLRKLLRGEGRLEPERALNLIEQVASALDGAHATGLVHRDVKPGNILVRSDKAGSTRTSAISALRATFLR